MHPFLSDVCLSAFVHFICPDAATAGNMPAFSAFSLSGLCCCSGPSNPCVLTSHSDALFYTGLEQRPSHACLGYLPGCLLDPMLVLLSKHGHPETDQSFLAIDRIASQRQPIHVLDMLQPRLVVLVQYSTNVSIQQTTVSRSSESIPIRMNP